MSEEKQKKARRKPDQTLPYADIMADIIVYCAAYRVSVGIGFERPYVKGQWEANNRLDLPLMVSVFKECPNDTIRDDDCEKLLMFKKLFTEFSTKCEDFDVHYFWIFSYEDRVFYNLEHMGDISKENPDTMWKIQLISPGYVEKKIRAPKEPIREVLLAFNDLPRGNETTDDLGDISDFTDQLQTDEEYAAAQEK